MNKTTLTAAIALVIVIVAAYFIGEKLNPPNQPPEEAPEVAENTEQQQIIREPAQERATPEPTPVTNAEPPLLSPPPNLDGSDRLVLELANDLSPALVTWMIPEEQIRKWVMTVDLLADGKIPRRYQPLDYPMEKFQTKKQGEKILLDTSNFNRATPLVDAVTKIPPAKLAAYLKYWQPLTESAYKELGKPGEFDTRLRSAIDIALATQPLTGDIELERPKVFYQFADKSLEQATDIEKLLWRLGPDNREKIQAYLRELKKEL